MQRGLVQCLAWMLATGAAVMVSWYGVRTVLTGTAYEPPRALPIADGAGPSPDSWSSSTHRPKPPLPSAPSPSPSSPASAAPKPKPTGTGKPWPGPDQKPAPGPAEQGGDIRSYPAKGGRVVLDIRNSWAELVSATPDGGWQMQVWKQSEWIRVDFVSGADTTTVFCTWHDGPPQVRVDEH